MAITTEAQLTPWAALGLECPSELDIGSQTKYLGLVQPLDAV